MSTIFIVLDANVLVKILVQEKDTAEANLFLKKCLEQKISIIVPEHFLYEVTNVCRYLGVELSLVLDLFEALRSSVLTVATPQRDTWLLAEEISKKGHRKSGFPSMYDSIYHALAIHADGVFVTADKRHFLKSQGYGHICLLKNWESVFE